ncbi:hypothetical protein PR001_g23361 [Phytophthora rubi]|uniref:Uncharacterized protein n=1 Tax=Phytophthora rubi TaxID=129364 RepID=A0A6A3ITQ2_9STRA|nr:hypothetical protein PR001_g23361 [Phytophthora rubi]
MKSPREEEGRPLLDRRIEDATAASAAATAEASQAPTACAASTAARSSTTARWTWTTWTLTRVAATTRGCRCPSSRSSGWCPPSAAHHGGGSSIKSLQPQTHPRTTDDLIKEVKLVFEEMTAATLNKIFLSLQAVMEQIGAEATTLQAGSHAQG